MQGINITDLEKLKTYLTKKGKFVRNLSKNQWKVKGNLPTYGDVAIVIEERINENKKELSVWFSCNKPAVEEFYADEFKRFQEKTL